MLRNQTAFMSSFETASSHAGDDEDDLYQLDASVATVAGMGSPGGARKLKNPPAGVFDVLNMPPSLVVPLANSNPLPQPRETKTASPVYYQFTSDNAGRELVESASNAFVHLREIAGRVDGIAVNGQQVPTPVTNEAVFPAIFSATTAQFNRVLATNPNDIDHELAVAMLKNLIRSTRTHVAPAASAPNPQRHYHRTHHAAMAANGARGYDSFYSQPSTPVPHAIAASPFLGGLATPAFGHATDNSFRARQVHFVHDGAASPYSFAGDSPATRDLPEVEEHATLIREQIARRGYEDDDDDVIGTTINGYTLVGDLGKGSFGRVMLGCHAITDEIVAIKIVHKSLINRERRTAMMAVSSTVGESILPPPARHGLQAQDAMAAEAAAAAKKKNSPHQPGIRHEIAVMKQLKHRHLVALKAVIDDPEADRLYLVMQYVPHGPFLAKVDRLPASAAHRTEPVNETQARRYSRQLISALRHLHKHNIVHRDVKPENILKGEDDCLFLADFGVSEIVDDLEVSRNVCGTRGTPAFWAPEMFDEQASVIDGVKQDEWALAVTIYLMLVGRLPFEGYNLQELSCSIQKDVLLLPDTLSHAARDFLRRALDRDMDSRLTLNEMRTHSFIVGPRPSRVRNKLQDRLSKAATIATGPSTGARPNSLADTIQFQIPDDPLTAKPPRRSSLSNVNRAEIGSHEVSEAVVPASIVRNNSIRHGSMRVKEHPSGGTSLQASVPGSTTVRQTPAPFPGIDGTHSRSPSPAIDFHHLPQQQLQQPIISSVSPLVFIHTSPPPDPLNVTAVNAYDSANNSITGHGPKFTRLTSLAVQHGPFTPNAARKAVRDAMEAVHGSFEVTEPAMPRHRQDSSMEGDDSVSEEDEETESHQTSTMMTTSGSVTIGSVEHSPSRVLKPSPEGFATVGVVLTPNRIVVPLTAPSSALKSPRSFSHTSSTTGTARREKGALPPPDLGPLARTGSYSVKQAFSQASSKPGLPRG
jgi:serine/threonine protein kinase